MTTLQLALVHASVSSWVDYCWTLLTGSPKIVIDYVLALLHIISQRNGNRVSFLLCMIVVRRTTGQPRLSAIVQAQRLSLFGHIVRMPDETDARSIITASPSENWRRPPGRPRTTWMKTIQQDLRSNNLSLDEAITAAHNRPFWRLMSAFGATHP